MGRFRGPRPSMDISDRIGECEFDLETAFVALVDEAVATGWKPTEVTMAITGLADNYMLGLAENRRLADKLAFVLRNMRRPGFGGARDF